MAYQIQYQQELYPDGFRWSTGYHSDLPEHVAADEARRSLAKRRRGIGNLHVVRIPNGIEFDSYHPGCAPAPEMQGARTRITYHD